QPADQLRQPRQTDGCSAAVRLRERPPAIPCAELPGMGRGALAPAVRPGNQRARPRPLPAEPGEVKEGPLMAIDTAPSEPSVTPRIELKIPIAVGPGDLAGPTPVSETLGSGRLEIAGL